MTAPPPFSTASLIARLLAWYDANRRALPWRAPPGHLPEPYHVLLSEIMLQQTAVATVKGRFESFLARFPTLAALADADPEAVLHEWQGLGYYRRARALHECARAVVARHGGRIPREEADLLTLPGIGPYTAAAVRAIAHGLPAVPVDGNVQRVLARLLAIGTPLPAAARELRERAAAFATAERPGDLAQALMDLGALVCRDGTPECSSCPLQASCAGHAAGMATSLPVRAARRERPIRRALAFLLCRPDGAILFRRRPAQGLLGGLHELPSSPWAEGELVLDHALAHAPQQTAWQIGPAPVRHVFTHFVLELVLARGRTEAPGAGLWCATDQLHGLALPTLMKKVLRRAGLLQADIT